MQTLKFSVKKVTLQTRESGTDLIILALDAPSPFPNMGYEPELRLEAQKGSGRFWCQVMGIEIDATIEGH
jgi:hypothetical protein